MQTFLFTDVEGSTRLWERSAAGMSGAIARQERILRDAIEVRGGSVFNTAGDSVCAVFASPNQAVAAAIEAQRALLAEPWERYAPELRILVRMAVDSGETVATGGNYLGPALNQLHRLMKTGHGGQILCGPAVADAGSFGPGIELRYLGSHTLRDVSGELRIFQIDAPGLPHSFPRLIVDRPASTRLPYHPATLFGRETELEEIGAMLRDRSTRVLTMLGPGGVGKTTLAVALAEQLQDLFPDGVHFVDLSALQDESLVAPTIARTLEIEDALLSPEDALVAGLRSRDLLLVLDNCEQIVAEVARVVARLVGETERISVLATSRLPLRIAAERELHIEPLPVPERQRDAGDNPAVQLFTEHARQVNARFALSDSVGPAVVDICRMVDGLPLAIELAAAWVRILDPATLRDRMAQGAPLLRSDARDRPERHRTLTSTIDWSYQLLDPAAQRAFCRLAVFQGGIPLDGALAVLQADDRASFIDALEQLDLLVQANLLQSPIQTPDGPRYAMLQMIQEFALSTLSTTDRLAASRAHAGYFAAMTASAATHYRDPAAPVWMARIDANSDNLRAAIAWLASPGNETSTDALETANHLSEYFELRNQNLENRRILTAALGATSSQPSKHLARSLARLGSTWLGQPEQAAAYYRRSIEMMESLPDAEPPFDGLVGLMALAQMQGDFAAAVSYARTFLHHARTTKRPEMIANALLALGQLLSLNDEPDEAITCWNESRAISVQLGDEVGLAWIQRAEGEMRFWQGDHDRAEQLYLQAIAALEASGGRKLTAVCELGITKIAALRRDRTTACTYLTRAVDEISRGGFDLDTLHAVTTGGLVCTLVLHAPTTAIELFSAAESWSQVTGIRETPQSTSLNMEIWQRARLQVETVHRRDSTPLSLRAALELLRETLHMQSGQSSTTGTLVRELSADPAG